jgi:glycine/D-amino acid oxidase-like deaminating enzyme
LPVCISALLHAFGFLIQVDKTVVLNPSIFLPWLKQRLEHSGVLFSRIEVNSLSELRHLEHDILINATGVGSASLEDVKDPNIQMIRGQTIVVKHGYSKSWQRDDGKTYTYAIPRMDGTVVLGGVRQYGRTSVSLSLRNWKELTISW